MHIHTYGLLYRTTFCTLFRRIWHHIFSSTFNTRFAHFTYSLATSTLFHQGLALDGYFTEASNGSLWHHQDTRSFYGCNCQVDIQCTGKELPIHVFRGWIFSASAFYWFPGPGYIISWSTCTNAI